MKLEKKNLRIVEKIYYLKDSEVPFTGKVSEGRDRLYYLMVNKMGNGYLSIKMEI